MVGIYLAAQRTSVEILACQELRNIGHKGYDVMLLKVRQSAEPTFELHIGRDSLKVGSRGRASLIYPWTVQYTMLTGNSAMLYF